MNLKFLFSPDATGVGEGGRTGLGVSAGAGAGVWAVVGGTMFGFAVSFATVTVSLGLMEKLSIKGNVAGASVAGVVLDSAAGGSAASGLLLVF